MPAQEKSAGEDAPAVAILRRLGRDFPKDSPSRFIAVYLGVGVIISFLFVASVAPQLGEKFGLFSFRKTGQDAAAKKPGSVFNLSTPSKPTYTKSCSNGTNITFNWTRVADATGYTVEVSSGSQSGTATVGNQTSLSWNASSPISGIGSPRSVASYSVKVKAIGLNNISSSYSSQTSFSSPNCTAIESKN